MEPAPGVDGLDAQVAQAVRVELARRSWDQDQLATRAGMNKSTLSRKVRALTPWRLDEVARVAAAFGVPMADLIPGSTMPADPKI